MALSINTNSRGTDVTRLQQALASRGFNPQGVDGALAARSRRPRTTSIREPGR